MNALGAVTPIKEITCDGGSTITIDYNETFYTDSGNSISPFSIDTTTIAVGDKVRVHFERDPEGNATLNCKDCSIQKIP